MFKDSHEVRQWEYNQELISRPDRLRDEWMRKHPGACPYCGGYDGMLEWYRAELERPPEEHETFYRLPDSDHAIFAPCPRCQTDSSAYVLMTHEEALAWYEDAPLDA